MTIQPERSGGAVTALFLSGEGGPHSPRGPFVLLNLRRVTTRGRQGTSEGDTKWAPLRSLPLCLCYAGSSSHGTSLAYLLGLTFPRCWWWSTLRFLFRPERLLRLLLISQQPEVPTFSRNTKIADCIWNLVEPECYRPNYPF